MNANVRPLGVEALRARVAAFEQKYGVPSERLFEPFTVDGELDETEDFLEWSFLHETLEDVNRLSAKCIRTTAGTVTAEANRTVTPEKEKGSKR